jgi:amidohydrolase
MASSDKLEITVRGKQTHAAFPWRGVDPIVVSAQVIEGLQTIASRQMDLTQAPVIVSIGKIQGGVRGNIIPEQVQMSGTLRALDEGMRKDLHARVERTVTRIAESTGASAEVSIGRGHAYPVTVNDPHLTARMLPTLRRVVGEQGLIEATPRLSAEDFSFYAREIPGLFVLLGVRTRGEPREAWASTHSALFRLDEAALETGVRVLAHLAVDYLEPPAPPRLSLEAPSLR